MISVSASFRVTYWCNTRLLCAFVGRLLMGMLLFSKSSQSASSYPLISQTDCFEKPLGRVILATQPQRPRLYPKQ